MTAINVLATITAPQGRRDELAKVLTDLAALVAEEPGNLIFSVNENSTEAGAFVVFESYQDEDAVAAHRTSEHIATFRTSLVELGIRPDLTFLMPLN